MCLKTTSAIMCAETPLRRTETIQNNITDVKSPAAYTPNMHVGRPADTRSLHTPGWVQYGKMYIIFINKNAFINKIAFINIKERR